MAESRWQKIDEIFLAASNLNGPTREEYLRSACRGENAMLSEIQALLWEHDHSTSSLDGSLFDIGLKVLDGSDVDERAGSKIGHFRIGRSIGRGGMGAVYVAEDTDQQRTVAIKLVNELFSLDPERTRRFRKEAKAAARVSHPNVAKLFGLYEFGDEHVIVMEFVDGVNLRQYMADGMPVLKSINIAAQVAAALVAAHSVGVVHRDIKPENIIIKPDGTIKVLDFGLAKLVDPIGEGAIHIPGGDDTRLTVDMSTELGALMGTPAYMSPEQIRGADVDTQTDIWSLGVLLYELLTGELPFRGPTKIDLIAGVLMSEPRPVKIDGFVGVDRVNAVLSKALSKEKADRYSEARVLLTDIEAIKYDAETRSDGEYPYRPLGMPRALKCVAGLLVLTTLLIMAVPASRRLVVSKFFTPPPATGLPPLRIADGLVSYWPADGNANDVVSSNNGELLNGATYRPGVSGQAFSFDGVDDLMQAPTNGFPTGNSQRTVAMWIKADDFVTIEACLGAYGNYVFEQAYALGISGKSLFITSWGEGASGPALEAGKWYHVAATTQALAGYENSLSLYLDGTLVKTSNVKIDTPAGTLFYCGRIPDLPEDIRRLKGAVDEIEVFDRALSAEEIRTLFLEHTPPQE